jgi:hypothetical protein
LAGILGGATERVIEAVAGSGREPLPNDPSVSQLYSNPPVTDADGDPMTEADVTYDPQDLWREFAELGTSIRESSLLSTQEYEELATTGAVDRVIQLVLVGLSRLQAEKLGERKR